MSVRVDSGSKAYPSPVGPWVSSAVRSAALNGSATPLDTGICGALHSSSRPRLFAQTWSTETLPAVEAIPTISASSLARR
ncbi:Uncharacterised protein [Mycobacteroides abscessus subsp. abscessus]|nr:Uncharacterised protein [Mycobacteroides abscessus subsp. abscessus]